MKKGILFLLIIATASARAQSLKELLYSGKLKSDSNTVVRKTDDLSTKIDTSTRKPPEPPKVIAVIPGDSLKKPAATTNTAAATVTTDTKEAGTDNKEVGGIVEPPVTTTAAAATVAPAKTPNKIWKEYTDSLVNSIKTDVIANKKVKKESYYLTVDYEIDVDGAVSVTNLVVAPENDYLQDQVKQRIVLSPPTLSPVVDSSNKPRKVKRRYNFTITKE